MKRSTLLAALLDVAAYAVITWYMLPAHVRQELHARAWHTLASGARSGAHTLGLVALAAEVNYWKAVRS